MQLKLHELQKIVDKAKNKERKIKALKEEVSRILGGSIVTTRTLRDLAESANKRLDVLEYSKFGELPRLKSSILLEFAESDDAEVRKMVSRLLPENFVKLMIGDEDAGVRAAIAKRSSSWIIKEMIKVHPHDEFLHQELKEKLLTEAGLPNPKASAKELDVNGHMRLDPVFDPDEHPGFTDAWYDTKAREIITRFGGNIEGQWEEIAVKSFFNSMKTFGSEIDEQKLLDAVYDLMSNRDENALEEGSLKNLANHLRACDAEVMPILTESKDDLAILLESAGNYQEFSQKFEKEFFVEKKIVKESFSRMTVPFQALLPHNRLGPREEKAFDTYVKHWNSQRSLKSQPYRISWHPTSRNKIRFSLERK